MFLFDIAIGFFILLAVELLLLLGLVIAEKPFSALLSCVVFVGLSDFFFGTGILSTIWHNPANIFLALLGYLGVGLLWSFPKWWFYVRKLRGELLTTMAAYRKQYRIDPAAKLDPAQLDRFHSFTAHRWVDAIPPLASQHKILILNWMMYWPFSIIGTLCDEPLKKAFTAIFEAFRGVYQKISESAFRGVEF